MRIGIDFGTTNSAVAVLGADGRPSILELAPGERVQRTVIHASESGRVTFGNAAFRAYLEQDLTGRFLRSIKAFLPQEVPRTTLAGRRYEFHELVTAYLRFLVSSTEQVTGERVTHVVVGRPVRFHADPERNQLAGERLERAIAAAGITSWQLRLEPVAAAHLRELTLTRPRTVLVGDFGGGTSDFAIFRAGPDRVGAADRLADVLATSGVAAAGDALDGRFMETFLLDAFGKGAPVRKPYTDAVVPWEHPVHRQILQLYQLPLLRTRALEEGLRKIEPWMVDPTVVRRLRKLVFDDLGYPMAWAIEAAKRAFSEDATVRFRFDEFHSEALDLERDVGRDAYAEGCAELLSAYDGAVDRVLADAGLEDEQIDDVFLTGGTSQLPFLRERFARRFGADKLSGADALTSVCEGLVLGV